MFPAIVLVVASLVPVPRAQAAERPGALSEVPLPGGLRAALAAIDDRVAADRSQFLLEFIRRTYRNTAERPDGRESALDALLAHLDLAARAPGPHDTLPLPLTPEIWIDVVFGGRASPQTLVAEILRTRGPSLLYYGLLSLDDPTRAWLATKPELIRELVEQYPTGFAVAAPGLRVDGSAVRVPGGELARPGWEALVGRRATDPVEFVRAVVAHRARRFPYFFAAMAELPPAQIAYALNVRPGDAAGRADALRRLHAAFERVTPAWRLDEQTFWRPSMDPALLLTQLRTDAAGRPVLPGTRRFWTAVFAGAPDLRRGEAPRVLIEGEPVEFAWLCDQIFAGEQRQRYPLVLFASRVVRDVAAGSALDALEAVGSAARFPALAAALERASVTDVGVYASAARRAARLSSIDDRGRAFRALAQFQASLALVTRAGRRGGIPAHRLPALISSLSAVELSSRGEYEGRMVRWLEALLRDVPAAAEFVEEAADPMERALLQILAGSPELSTPEVDWEGTRYSVDTTYAESLRIGRLLGDVPRPYLSAALALVNAADALDEPGLTRERLREEAAIVARLARAVGGEFEAPLERLVRSGDVRGAPRLADALRRSADALLARGLIEFTYAAAMGQPRNAAISAADAAGRHSFGLELGSIRGAAPWRLPAAGSGFARDWHVRGSLLGLDVKLAEFSLLAVSSKPPVRKPSVPEEERRVFIEALALLEPAALADTDRDSIVVALQTGRARLSAVRTPAQAAALAERIRMSAARRSLLEWVADHDRPALPIFLSLGELVAVGLEGGSSAAALHAWGAPAEPRAGCLCLQFLEPQPVQIVEGRWNSGLLASAFPDLHLRIAELLAELRMPAALLPSVLAPAMLDFVNTAECRDPDDRRGLLDFVRAVAVDRIEEYLALLTTEGPLVPVTEGRSEVAR